jgi:hypothetical protein
MRHLSTSLQNAICVVAVWRRDIPDRGGTARDTSRGINYRMSYVGC